MNRYNDTLDALRRKKETAFIPFAVAGDTTIATSEAILKTYVDSGADVLEIGYPFSDPAADGPINQRAAMRAIESGLTHATFFKLISTVRKYSTCPIGILLYANSAHYIGYNSFCKQACDAGIDSLLVADMPPEEFSELGEAMEKHGLQTVFIVSELTPTKRLKYICDQVTGFVYVVSRLGTTGVHTELSSSTAKTLASVRKVTQKPLCVGFGISTPEHVIDVKKAGADGAIVGSALVKIIEDNKGDTKTMLKKLSNSIKAFKDATR